MSGPATSRPAGSPPKPGVDTLGVVVEAAPIGDGARPQPGEKGESLRVTEQDAAMAALREPLRPGDVVLQVKGLRPRTREVAHWLRGAAGAPPRREVVAR